MTTRNASWIFNGLRHTTTWKTVSKRPKILPVSRRFSSILPAVYAYKTFDPEMLKLPVAKYGGRQTITALPGDGIGPEMIDHLDNIFDVAHVPIDIEIVKLNSTQMTEDDLEDAIVSIERNGICIKGNIETKFVESALVSRNVELRVRLDLYANVVRVISLPNVKCKYKNLDIVMIRQNTEGEYSGIEHELVPGVVESLKIVTRTNIERIARFAFEQAVKFGRKKITAVHKANIMKIGDGLFLEVCAEVAAQYPQIKYDKMIIDNASMQLVSNPYQFDVILMPNLYGNILSNIGCGLVGGAGILSGFNCGDKYIVFETGSRNTGTNIAGKDIANPTAFIRAGINMLYNMGLNNHAKIIRDSLIQVICEDRIQTADIGGTYKTSEVVNAVIEEIKRRMAEAPAVAV